MLVKTDTTYPIVSRVFVKKSYSIFIIPFISVKSEMKNGILTRFFISQGVKCEGIFYNVHQPRVVAGMIPHGNR